MNATTLARKGEQAAADYLERRSMTIVDRNWRCRSGELDIVALDDETLVFCEVKTRRTDRAGSPEDAVETRKQHRIRRVAQVYLARAGLHDVTVRFDVVAIDVRADRAVLRHLRDAFRSV